MRQKRTKQLFISNTLQLRASNSLGIVYEQHPNTIGAEFNLSYVSSKLSYYSPMLSLTGKTDAGSRI